jgi:restriction system protein
MKKDLNIFDFLVQVPWWVYVSLSGSFYVLLQYVIPFFEKQSVRVNEVHVSLGPVLAPVVALALLSPVTFTFLKSSRKKKLHDLRDKIKSIQALERDQFKEYVADAYAQAGYLVLKNDPHTSDPDVDLVLRKSSNLYLLQSRYWLNRKLGQREVKKLYSLMRDKQASGIFLLTTGIFTRDARRFAIGRSINLIDGIKLAEMLDSFMENGPAPKDLYQ